MTNPFKNNPILPAHRPDLADICSKQCEILWKWAGSPSGHSRRHAFALRSCSSRIGAAMGMQVDDVYARNRRLWVRLHEKGGKQHAMPRHHNLVAYLHAYIDGAGLAHDPKALLFQSYSRATGQLAGNPLPQANAYAMIQRRRAGVRGITTNVGNHTFRATGVTAYLKNGGTLEKRRANGEPCHARARRSFTTGAPEEVTLDEVERILV